MTKEQDSGQRKKPVGVKEGFAAAVRVFWESTHRDRVSSDIPSEQQKIGVVEAIPRFMAVRKTIQEEMHPPVIKKEVLNAEVQRYPKGCNLLARGYVWWRLRNRDGYH